MPLKDSILASAPLFFWECLDPAASGRIIDTTARQRAGGFTFGTASSQGRFPPKGMGRPGYNFDATGSAAAPSTSPNPGLTAPWSVEALVFPGSGSGDRLIVGNGSGSGGTVAGWHVRLKAGDLVRFILIKDGSNFVGIDTTTAVSISASLASMCHLVCMYDGSGASTSALQIWVNGRKQSVTTVTGGTVTTISTTQAIQIAGGFSGVTGFSGLLKAAAFYNRLLGAAEIVDHYTRFASEITPIRRRRIALQTSTSLIKTIMGVSYPTSVKTAVGLAQSSVKTIDGLA